MQIFLEIVSSFSLQLIIAELMFCFFLKKRKWFWLRLSIVAILFVGLTYELPFMTIFGIVPMRFVVTFTISIFVLWFCFDCSIWSIMFCCASGFAVRGIAQNIYVLTEYIRNVEVYFRTDYVLYLTYIITYILCFFIFAYRFRKRDIISLSNIKIISVAIVITVIDGFCSMWRYNFKIPMNFINPLYGVMSCTFALMILFQFFRESELTKQNYIMEQLLRKEQEQFEISRQNVEMLNMKCHDIKHNVDLLKKVDNKKEVQFYYGELEKVASTYDDIAKTGNAALDVVLMEKKPIFDKQDITFSYMAEGKSIDFISALDIYSLFGNILSNAIEHVIDEDEKNNRFISLKVYEKAGFSYIHLDNYCSTAVKFEGNLPVTTKGAEYHGYGTKSVMYIVNKYKGIVRFVQQNSRFNVHILIPKP